MREFAFSVSIMSMCVCNGPGPAASPDLSAGSGVPAGGALDLKELLELHRQRREQSKQHFLLSTPPTPTSCGSISLCHSPTPSSMTVGETSNDAEQEPDQGQDQQEGEEPEEEMTEHDSALQLTTSTSNVMLGALPKSPSANSSLHLLYTSIFRKLGQGKRRRKRGSDGGGISPSEDEDDVDGGVCDISGGDLSDDYDHCDVALRRRSLRSRHQRDVSETDYHGDAEADAEGETAPRESCYETSDTGGELTNTDDLDSSLNLISNLSYNSSNNSHTSNAPGGGAPAHPLATTTAPGKSGHALSVQGGRQQPKTGALAHAKPKPKPMSHMHKAQGKGGSLSSPSRIPTPATAPPPRHPCRPLCCNCRRWAGANPSRNRPGRRLSHVTKSTDVASSSGGARRDRLRTPRRCRGQEQLQPGSAVAEHRDYHPGRGWQLPAVRRQLSHVGAPPRCHGC